MKIIVCGGRDYNNKTFLYEMLDYFNTKTKIATLIHGGAKGADSLAALWAHENNINCIMYPANWNKYGKGAGFIRNTEMIKSNLDAKFLVAFPGGSGTLMACDIATTNKLKVIKLW